MHSKRNKTNSSNEINNSLHQNVRKKASQRSHNVQYLYMNSRSMGNNREELVILVEEGKYDLIEIIEIWWDDSHDWNMTVEGFNYSKRKEGIERGMELQYMLKKFFHRNT